MTTDTDVDVEDLRSDIDQIKAAMGIQERYSGAPGIWLLFAGLVAVASACSQYVHLEQLDQFYHTVIWVGILGGGVFVWFLRSERPREMEWSTSGKPNLFVQFGLVYLSVVPVQAIVANYTPDLGYQAEGTMVLSIILVALGVAYGILGSSMRAYHIRFRDRAVFYVGTAWMVALGTVMPYVEAIHPWIYAVFGGTYVVYALAAYAVLRTSSDPGGGGEPA